MHKAREKCTTLAKPHKIRVSCRETILFFSKVGILPGNNFCLLRRLASCYNHFERSDVDGKQNRRAKK